jgi:hypothetical protein
LTGTLRGVFMEGDEFGNVLGMSMGLEGVVCKIFFLGEILLLTPLLDCALFTTKFTWTGVLVKYELLVTVVDKSLLAISNLFLIFSTLLLDSGGDTYDIVSFLEYHKHPTWRTSYTPFTSEKSIILFLFEAVTKLIHKFISFLDAVS